MLWGISSEMNVPRKAAVERSCNLSVENGFLYGLKKKNYVKVGRPWPRLFHLEKYGSSPLAGLLTDPDCAPESAKSVSTSMTAHIRVTG